MNAQWTSARLKLAILMHSEPDHVKTRNNDTQWATTGRIKKY